METVRCLSTALAVCSQSRVRATQLEQSFGPCSRLVGDSQNARERLVFPSRLAWFLCLLVSLTAVAQQETAHRAVKLQRHGVGKHGLETKWGSGWCVDAGCSLLATNYHVARGGLPRKVDGVKVRRVALATGPDDYGAVWVVTTYDKWLRYNPLNDVALISLSRPLLPGTAAASFYADDLRPGQELVVHGFPSGGKQEAIAAEFLQMADGLLELSLGTEAPAGLSGSMVADQQGRVVGMLSFVTDGRAFAVPLWSIAEAIRKFHPALHSQLFPDGLHKPAAFQASMALDRDLAAAIGGSNPAPALPLASMEDGLGQPFPDPVMHSARLFNVRETPADILELRHRAQQMFRQMDNFRALQTLRLSTEGKPELTWLQEVYVESDNLVFRDVDDGQLMRAVAFPHRQRSVVPGGEWRHLPQIVADELKGARVEEIGTKDVGGEWVRVFHYQASAEDQVCWFRFRTTHVFWSHDRQFPVACRGEIWTDGGLNVLRISQELEVREHNVPMQSLQLAVLYGWLGPDLVPVDMVVEGAIAGHMCRAVAHFSNYRQVLGH
jgi:hypothetical protein